MPTSKVWHFVAVLDPETGDYDLPHNVPNLYPSKYKAGLAAKALARQTGHKTYVARLVRRYKPTRPTVVRKDYDEGTNTEGCNN